MGVIKTYLRALSAALKDFAKSLVDHPPTRAETIARQLHEATVANEVAEGLDHLHTEAVSMQLHEAAVPRTSRHYRSPMSRDNGDTTIPMYEIAVRRSILRSDTTGEEADLLSIQLEQGLRALNTGQDVTEEQALAILTVSTIYGATIPDTRPGGEELTVRERGMMIIAAREAFHRARISGTELERYMQERFYLTWRDGESGHRPPPFATGGVVTGRVTGSNVNRSNKPKAKRKPAHVLAAGRIHSIKRWKTNRRTTDD